jgi:LAS superfamily LD-carboxypeptidase LdcB
VRRALSLGVRFKVSEALRFLGGLAAAIVLLGLLVLRVTSCAPLPPLKPPPPIVAPAPPAPKRAERPDCGARGWERAAATNASSLRALPWAPFRRPEIGWETYAPTIAREIGTSCPPDSPAFAGALAAWQGKQRIYPDGLVSEQTFVRMKGVVQTRRPFVQVSAQGICPGPPSEPALEPSRPGEGYAEKPILLRRSAFEAYRRMVAAAKAEEPRIAADPRNLTIFSGYRSPEVDAARCAAEGNCNGVERATCSPHRTGLALDMYVGQAPGFGPDSTADPNRLFMTTTPTYQWLVAHAHRYGFVNYPFEPWHWEWTGEAP